MDTFNPVRLLARYWLLVLGVTALAFGAALYVQSQKPANYFGSMSVNVQASRNYPETEQLILQTDSSADSQALVATTQAWVADPSYVREILSRANITAKDASLKGLSKVFKVVVPVADSTSYSIQFSAPSEDEVRRAYSELRTVIDGVKDQYNSKDTGLIMDLFYSEPVITKESSDLPLTPVAGLLGGFVFAVATAALLDRSKKA